MVADVLELRLRELLREDLGGTYHVSVDGSVSRYPGERYRIDLGFGCDPGRVEELTGVCLRADRQPADRGHNRRVPHQGKGDGQEEAGRWS